MVLAVSLRERPGIEKSLGKPFSLVDRGPVIV
jgi:hypothetical protein